MGWSATESKVRCYFRGDDVAVELTSMFVALTATARTKLAAMKGRLGLSGKRPRKGDDAQEDVDE